VIGFLWNGQLWGMDLCRCSRCRKALRNLRKHVRGRG
jgi:hypothetical protein